MIRRPRMIRTRAVAYMAGAMAVLSFAMTASAASAALTVTITSGPSGTTTDTTAVFEFSANVRDASVTCSLDGAPATACTSPRTYRALAIGRHEFVVTAISGRESARASRSWQVESSSGPQPPTHVNPCESPLPVVICFDDLAPGTVVTSQYAAQGVEVGFGPTAPNGGVGAKAVIAADAGAYSDGQVLKAPGCGGDVGCPGHTIDFRFTWAHHVVRVRGGGGDKLTLTALDGLGNQVAQQTKQTGSDTSTLLAVTSPPDKPIIFFTVQGASPFGSFALDNLEFDAPAANTKPDFGLAWSAPWGDNKLALAAGGSSSTAIFITRLNGSTGPISFTAAGLPAGVTASFLPSSAATATTSVQLKVTASLNAQTGGPPIPISVIGHPTSATVGLTDHALQVPLLLVLGNFDARVSGIEVTQGIQSQVVPYYSGSNLSPAICKNFPSLRWTNQDPPELAYDATQPEVVQGLFGGSTIDVPFYVPLVADRATVVRAYANLAYPSTGSLSGVKMLLYGYAESPSAFNVGQPLPGSPLSPDTSPANLTPGNIWATCADRADPNAYTFTLPASWTEGRISLRAKIFPEDVVYGPGGECGSLACTPNNEQTLTHVLFQPMPTVTVTPFLMDFGGQLPGTPKTVFSQARFFSPSPLVWFGASDNSYAGVIDIQDIVNDSSLNTNKLRCNALLDRLEQSLVQLSLSALPSVVPHGNATVGVFAPGAGCGGVTDNVYLPSDGMGFSVVNAARPTTSVAHELFHEFGRVHADTACGGNSNGQIGEPWPPDQRGQIHGIGLDTRVGSGPGSAPYNPIVPGALLTGSPFATGQPLEWIDFMSYCVGGLESVGSNKSCPSCAPWISVQGWDETVTALTNFGQNFGSLRLRSRQLRRAAEAGPTVSVSALADGSDVRVLSVQPGGAAAARGSASDYRLVVRNGAGAIIGEAPLRGRSIDVHGEPPVLLLAGSAPSDGAASIEIVRNGVMLARRLRSRYAPTVEVLAPRVGAHVGRERTVGVVWKAADADGDTLDTTIDYSLDGGSAWRTIFSGRRPGSVALPSTLFAGSRNARVRVRVNDGWNTAEAVSAPFIAVGRPPSVSISTPVPGQRARHDTDLNLAGAAYDDRGKEVAANRLVWFDGRVQVGRGARAVVFRPGPGRHTIRLVARDARGRSGSASVRIRVFAVAPHLLDLRAPAYVGRRATRLAFAVATTIPATLTAGGRRYAVGRTLRRVQLSIRPGRAILRVPLRLVAGGKVTRTLLIVPRR